MGNCIFCGRPAGFLRNRHIDCEEENRKRDHNITLANDHIFKEAISVIKGLKDFVSLDSALSDLGSTNGLSSNHIRALLIRAWEKSVDDFLEDGVLDKHEELRLVEFKEHFAFTQNDLNKNGALTKTTKAGVLRDVLEGKIPERVLIEGSIAINFHKTESVIWAFPETKLLEDKTRRQYIGSSQGMSFRIMKGVYYRVGAFKGHAVENTERIHVDTGFFVITNQNIYFAGPLKSLKIPYSKIVSFQAFSDGIGVMRDSANAKPQIFVTGDGWFTYNLVANLARS